MLFRFFDSFKLCFLEHDETVNYNVIFQQQIVFKEIFTFVCSDIDSKLKIYKNESMSNAKFCTSKLLTYSLYN